MRYFLPVYLTVNVFVAFVWRSYAVWKKSGINPVTFSNTDNAHDFIGRVFKFGFATVVLVIFLYSVSPAAYEYTAPIDWLEQRWLRWSGVAIMLVAFVWIVIAQAQMGQSWRIGIDTEHRTPLVQTGVFRISRNPIYVGLIAQLLGLFLSIPNAVTLLVLVLSVVVIGIQVRLEEEFLAIAHPLEYAEYRKHVRRWI